VFERVVGTCIAADLVGGEGFAIDASLVEADANKHRSIPGTQWPKELMQCRRGARSRSILATLDDPAYGASSDVTYFVSPLERCAMSHSFA
jgi:hypothetical protein